MSEHHSNERSAVFFRTTHWSVVLAAGAGSEDSGRALELLCRTYWYPLYAFVRRKGFSPHEAQDLTQEFFARLLDAESLQSVQPEKGRFRTFLLASLKHFLANEWRNAKRLKRGGAYQFLSWDEIDPEERYALEPQTGHSPEELFDRRWAHTIVANSLERLRTEMELEGNAERFETLKVYLQSDAPTVVYVDAAKRLNLTEAAVKSAIHRLRKRYAEFIRSEIAETVQSPDEVEEELRRLIKTLAS